MTLDLEQVARYLPILVETVRREHQMVLARRQAAINALRAAASDPERFVARLRETSTQRPLALLLSDPPDAVYSAPAVQGYAVLAVDGSHIQPQRDSPVPCSVMNFGWCKIVYRQGYPPDLRAETEVQIAATPDDDGEENALLFSADALGVMRAVREVALAARLAETLPQDMPAVILLDGSLVPWSMNRLPRGSRQRETLLTGQDGLFRSLDRLKCWVEAAPHRAVVGYISYPAHQEVVYALQETVADRDSVNTGSDRALFWGLLRPYERSARFLLHSNREGWMEQEYGRAGHAVGFFYLHTGLEVARVEMPEWTARDDSRVSFIHSALLDQLERGLGYPLALMEAHERAVITTADRQAFLHLVESTLLAEGLPSSGSAKNLSKRGRWLT